MTDQNDQGAPGQEPTHPSANTPAKTAVTSAEQQALNSTEEKNMEVHHHAHHSGPKNWKSYIREFLMLFLAVFCGFLAEYQLEHTVEHDREEQYIESMISDMREDSVKIATTLQLCKNKIEGFDSLLQTIYQRPYTDSSLQRMYYLQLIHTHNRSAAIFTKRTITQLKNSGGLRLIRNKAASDSIILYSEECEMAESQAAYIETVRMTRVEDYSLRLFDNEYIFSSNGKYKNEFLNNKMKITLVTNDEKLLKEYANALVYARGSLRSYTNILKSILANIPFKIKFLEDNYH